MAGYIMGLDNRNSLEYCINSGIYSTNLSNPKNGKWMIHHEGTFADYFGMKEGDNIYFFIDRKIYGIGELTKIKYDCKYWNYINAEKPENFIYDEIKDKMILDSEENLNNRCLCIFKPYPNFFINGIDMDDVLASNPSKFRMLRAFWKLSFVKIDDEENNALKDIILKRNEEFILKNDNNSFQYNSDLQIEKLKVLNKNHIMNSKTLLESCNNDNAIKHEMAIEGVDQVMKYVDWINEEYAFGDYGMIQAFIVAYDFSEDVARYKDSVCIRNYTKGRRPTIPGVWNSVKLIKYSFENNSLNFCEVK